MNPNNTNATTNALLNLQMQMLQQQQNNNNQSSMTPANFMFVNPSSTNPGMGNSMMTGFPTAQPNIMPSNQILGVRASTPTSTSTTTTNTTSNVMNTLPSNTPQMNNPNPTMMGGNPLAMMMAGMGGANNAMGMNAMQALVSNPALLQVVLQNPQLLQTIMAQMSTSTGAPPSVMTGNNGMVNTPNGIGQNNNALGSNLGGLIMNNTPPNVMNTNTSNVMQHLHRQKSNPTPMSNAPTSPNLMMQHNGNTGNGMISNNMLSSNTISHPQHIPSNISTNNTNVNNLMRLPMKEQVHPKIENITPSSSHQTGMMNPSNPMNGVFGGTNSSVVNNPGTTNHNKRKLALEPDYKTSFRSFDDCMTRLDPFKEVFFYVIKRDPAWDDKVTSVAEKFLKSADIADRHVTSIFKREHEREVPLEDDIFFQQKILALEKEAWDKEREELIRKREEEKLRKNIQTGSNVTLQNPNNVVVMQTGGVGNEDPSIDALLQDGAFTAPAAPVQSHQPVNGAYGATASYQNYNDDLDFEKIFADDDVTNSNSLIGSMYNSGQGMQNGSSQYMLGGQSNFFNTDDPDTYFN